MPEKLDRLVDRVGMIEQRISDLVDTAAANSPCLALVKQKPKKALEKLENYENQSRRNNVKIIGLKETTKGRNPVTFCVKWIPKVLTWTCTESLLK